MEKIIFVLIIALCYSSMDIYYPGDLSTPIKINGIDSLKLNSECGDISLIALCYQVKEPDEYTIFLKHHFNAGHYVFHTDSFKILKPDGSVVKNIAFMHRGKK